MIASLGAHSPKLDAVRALRTKAGRAEQSRFAIEGPTLLADAIAAGKRPEAVFVTQRGEASLAAAVRDACPGRYLIPDRAMDRLSDVETPPGVLAVLPWTLDTPDILLDGAPTIILAGIADPGNAGTLLRTAEIFGIDRAILTRDGVEPYNPKVVRATMGALFRMRLAVATGAETAAATAAAGYAIVAATREGLPLPDYTFPERCAIAVGNERRGVAASLPFWESSVAIPQRGGGESLNAAVAGAIVIYAFVQARERSESLP